MAVNGFCKSIFQELRRNISEEKIEPWLLVFQQEQGNTDLELRKLSGLVGDVQVSEICLMLPPLNNISVFFSKWSYSFCIYFALVLIYFLRKEISRFTLNNY